MPTPEPLCENIAWYIYSPDDEVRELLYRVRRIRGIPYATTAEYCFSSTRIFVGRDFPQEQNDFDAQMLEAANKIFMCRLLDLQGAVYPASLSPALQDELKEAASYIYAISPGAQSYIERYSLDMDTVDVRTILDQLQCARWAAANGSYTIQKHCFNNISTDHAIPGLLDSLPAYDSLFLSAWHDAPELQAAGIHISFRPRWSLFPTEASSAAELEWPANVPDVVFSVRVSIPARLNSARRFHPGYVFSNRNESQESTVDIPILIVEYNKAFADSNVDVPGIDEHNEHLMLAMTAALPLHAVLGLQTPVAGLFINHDKLDSAYLGTLAESYNQMMPHIHRVVLLADSCTSKIAKPMPLYSELHIMDIRNIVANLRESASSIYAEIISLSGLEALHSVQWLTSPPQLEHSRRVIDTAHPASVVEDVLLNVLFSLPVHTDIKKWLEFRRLLVHTGTTSTMLPREIQEWISFFERHTCIADEFSGEQIEASKQGLSSRAYELLDLFTESCRTASISGDPAPTTTDTDLAFDVTCSLTFCLYARDLQGLVLDSHSLTNHWTVLYNSLFSHAWQKNDEGVELVLQHNTSWLIHPDLRIQDADDEISQLEELRPNCAFLIRLPSEYLVLRNHGGDYKDIEPLKPDFTVTRYYSDGTGTHYVQMPVLVVEYVLIPNNSNERSKHFAHLSIALRTALALWELHHVKAPVMGLLIDRNIATLVLAWMDDEGQCIIHEMDYTFNIFDPYDTFRLFRLVKAHGSEAFAEHVYSLIDEHMSEALDEVRALDYVTWREARPSRPLAPIDAQGWRAGVQNEDSDTDEFHESETDSD